MRSLATSVSGIEACLSDRRQLERFGERIDNAIKFIEKSLPVLRTQKGYRALLMNVDRMTGRGTVASVWDTQADLEASEAKVSGLRRDAADAAGAADVKVEVFETAFAEVKQPTKV